MSDVYGSSTHVEQEKGRPYQALATPQLCLQNWTTSSVGQCQLCIYRDLHIFTSGRATGHLLWVLAYRISTVDSELMSKNLVRNMCGDSFRSALVSSALGSVEALKHWEVIGRLHIPEPTSNL